MNKGRPLATVNLTPAFEVDLVLSSVASFLVRELLQLPACLCSMEAASLVLFHPFVYLVLGVVPRI